MISSVAIIAEGNGARLSTSIWKSAQTKAIPLLAVYGTGGTTTHVVPHPNFPQNFDIVFLAN